MDVGQQTRNVELASAMKQYQETRDGYERMVRRALMDPNPDNKAQYVESIRTENQRLVNIVQGLIQAYEEGKSQMSDGVTIEDLQTQLDDYKKQFIELQSKQDTNAKFQSMLNAAQASTTTAKIYYFGYLVAVLVLLVVLLLLFMFVGGTSVADQVISAIETPADSGGVSDALGSAGEAVSGVVGSAGEALGSAGEAVSSTVSSATESVKSGLGNITINVTGGLRRLFKK